MNRSEIDGTLAEAIDAAISRVDSRALARAAEALTVRYRTVAVPEPRDAKPGAAGLLPRLTEAERAAYLAVRAPATYAAVSAVLGELDERCPELAVRSLLDLGAGPGVGAWAALARFEAIASLTLVEQDRAAIALGREIAAAAGLAEGRAWTWQPQDLRGRSTLAPHDLVLMSYALGELDADARRRAVEAAWQATTGALVIIEPGTPRHFAGLLDARTQLIALGAVIVAPCPHARECPMGPAPSPSPSPSASPSSSESPSLSTVGGAPTDWCHFAVRLPRTRRHRLLKAGSLSYEDEKFSYVIAVPASSLRPSDHAAVTRIVRHPIYSKGRVELALCTADGLATRMVTHAARDDYRRARKVAWGDAWPA